MIISTSLLQKALKDRSLAKKRQYEGYTMLESTNAGMSLGFATGFLIIAIMFSILELLVLFYAVSIAYNCSTGHARVVHVVLSIVFTFPYILLMILFNKCSTATLAKI
jgi:hypothetical protein